MNARWNGGRALGLGLALGLSIWAARAGTPELDT
jgi:hypothetical protein